MKEKQLNWVRCTKMSESYVPRRARPFRLSSSSSRPGPTAADLAAEQEQREKRDARRVRQRVAPQQRNYNGPIDFDRDTTFDDADNERSASDGDQEAGDQPAPRERVQRQRAHRPNQDTLLARESNWRQAQPQLLLSLEAVTPALQQMHQQRSKTALDGIRRLIEGFKQYPVHKCGAAAGSVQYVSEREVTYLGTYVQGEVALPSFHCSCCSMEFEMPPTAAGCFGNAPISPGTIVDLALLNLAHLLKMRAGVSNSGFCSALNDIPDQMSWLLGSSSKLKVCWPDLSNSKAPARLPHHFFC